jgi:hypothetical protein
VDIPQPRLTPEIPKGLGGRRSSHWALWLLLGGLALGIIGFFGATVDAVVSINDDITARFPDSYRKEVAERMKDVPDLVRDTALIVESPAVPGRYDGMVQRGRVLRSQFGARKPAFVLTQTVLKRTGLFRTFVQAFATAIIVEYRFSSIEQTNLFLDHAYFGEVAGASVLGIHAAAKKYFSKKVAELDVAETAMLVGVIQAPSKYSPFENLEKADSRRTEVLRKMKEADLITDAEMDIAVAEPILPERD